MNNTITLLPIYLHTNGNGLWSEAEKPVKIVSMKIARTYPGNEDGELRVYFDTDTWDVQKQGLIYTDPQWLNELHDLFIRLGMTAADAIDARYSEQGMQGKDYVSLDVPKSFIKIFQTLLS